MFRVVFLPFGNGYDKKIEVYTNVCVIL